MFILKCRLDEARRTLFGSFLEQGGAGKEALPRRDVSTSRRHQVTTWRSTITEVNHSPRRDVITSRRHHVATSSRRDVITSRRHHVATSAKKICISSLNARRLGNLGHIGVCAARDTILETCNTDLKIHLGFLYWILFICLFGYFWII